MQDLHRFLFVALIGVMLWPHKSKSQFIQLDTIRHATNLEIPWEMEWAGNDALWFTERPGYISRLDLSSGTIKRLYTFDEVANENQAGLMGLQLHPNWPDSTYAYVSYAYYTPNFQIRLALARLFYDQFQDSLINLVHLVDDIPGDNSALGSRLLIVPSGHIFMTVGDVDDGEIAQDTSEMNGKILRFDLNGQIPADNPFPNNPVWSMGHRNPQGLARTPDGTLYSSEHGPSSDDELNRIMEGRNYGWPLILGFCSSGTQDLCDSLNIAEPIATWSPPVAPAGIAYYHSDSIPEWKNSILMCYLRGRALQQLKLNASGDMVIESHAYVKDQIGRIRDVAVSPDGRVFVCTSNHDILGDPGPLDDRIYELKSMGPAGISLLPESQLQIQRHSQQIMVSWPLRLHPIEANVWNMSGQLVHRQNFLPDDPSMQLSNALFPRGIYVLSIRFEEGLILSKLQP